MNYQNKEVRVASSNEVMVTFTILLIVSVIICFFDQSGELIKKRLDGETQDKTCRVVDIRTEYGPRTRNQFTIFEDEEGKQYELKTTFKDRIGRESVISVTGYNGYRKSYEIIKPQSAGWAVYLMPLICIISLIIYPIKAKEKGLW